MSRWNLPSLWDTRAWWFILGCLFAGLAGPSGNWSAGHFFGLVVVLVCAVVAVLRDRRYAENGAHR